MSSSLLGLGTQDRETSKHLNVTQYLNKPQHPDEGNYYLFHATIIIDKHVIRLK